MPELNLKDSIITSFTAQEPWPDNVKLFQPYEVEQILLPDNASCLAVQAFLKMCNLPFEVEMRWNAEFMSPSGRVPFIKCGAFVVSELEPIVQFAANKGVSLCSRLTTEEKAEMRAYMSLITNVLVNAELYISWLDNDTYNAVTKVRNSSVYPWPLGWIQTRSKRSMVAKRLKALHWHDKTLDQVLADVEQCCNSLSQRLGDKDYFFGIPTPLDALIYGHVRALLGASGPRAALLIKSITTALLAHTLRIVRATNMKLTPQEEYLVSQASLVSCRRREPRRSERGRGERPGHDNLPGGDVFGFKPFASKHIALTVSKDGNLTCEYEGQQHIKIAIDDEECAFIDGIIDEVIEKVDEVTVDLDKVKDTDKVATGVENAKYTHGVTTDVNDPKYTDEVTTDVNDPKYTDEVTTDVNDPKYTDEVTTDVNDPKYTDEVTTDVNNAKDTDKDVNEADFVICNKPEIYDKVSDYLETIDENDSTLPDSEDVIKIIDSETDDDVVLVDDIKENTQREKNESESKPESMEIGSEDFASSRNMSTPSELGSLHTSNSDSRSTLKMPSKEEISVENLLEMLRRKNPDFHNFVEVVEVD